MAIALLVSTRGIFNSGESNGPIPGRMIMVEYNVSLVASECLCFIHFLPLDFAAACAHLFFIRLYEVCPNINSKMVVLPIECRPLWPTLPHAIGIRTTLLAWFFLGSISSASSPRAVTIAMLSTPALQLF